MTTGPLPMACPEGHEFTLPNPSFPKASGLYDPCVSLLYTPCPVQPPLALSLYPASHSHPALCVYSASSSATQPNKATLVRSLAPTGQTLPRFTTLKRMGKKNMQRTFCKCLVNIIRFEKLHYEYGKLLMYHTNECF